MFFKLPCFKFGFFDHPQKSAREQKAYRAPSLNTEMERRLRTEFFVSPSFMKFSAAWHEIHEFVISCAAPLPIEEAQRIMAQDCEERNKKKAWPWIVVHKGKIIWSERQQLRGRLQR